VNEKWYSRLADLPGAGYAGSPGVNRTKLPGAKERPSTLRLGGGITAMQWGSGSQSPASRHAFDDPSEHPSAAMLQRLAETLELPGTASEYHFAIQRTLGALWSRRRDQPETLEEVERLGWIDIHLVEASPGDFRIGNGSRDREYYSITAFNTLRLMYEREGLLRQAVDVERLAAKFGQGRSLDELEAKLNLLNGASE
jgi:hypothetical protein